MNHIDMTKPKSGRIISSDEGEDDYYFATLENIELIKELKNPKRELSEEEEDLFMRGLENSLCSFIGYASNRLEVFDAKEMRAYFAKLLNKIEYCQSLDEAKSVIKEGLDFDR